MRRLGTTVGLAMGLLTLTVGPVGSQARAAGPPSSGSAEVRSVDGPGRLTLERNGKAIPVRLFFTDTPQDGECGAKEATAALRGFVRRAPRRVRYVIAERRTGDLARDTDGRYLAQVTYSVRDRDRGFGSDLMRADWARLGESALVNGGSSRDAELVEANDNGTEEPLTFEPRARRGVWARCGGHLHLGAGEPVPPSSAAPWAVDANGVASAVGPITLSPTLTPATTMTLRDLAALSAAELTRADDGCRAWFPSLQIRAFAVVARSTPCGDGAVSAVSTVGPDRAAFTRGGGVGSPIADLRSIFPLLVPSARFTAWRLSGPSARPWAWQTSGEFDQEQRIQRLVAYASPSVPSR